MGTKRFIEAAIYAERGELLNIRDVYYVLGEESLEACHFFSSMDMSEGEFFCTLSSVEKAMFLCMCDATFDPNMPHRDYMRILLEQNRYKHARIYDALGRLLPTAHMKEAIKRHEELEEWKKRNR